MRLYEPLDLVSQMVQTLYCAENQLVLALPRIAARAANPDLQAALDEHLTQTREHAKRLEELADALGIPCAGKRSLAMEGLLKEGELALGYGGDGALVDSAIIASCQAAEHYEITQYQALIDLISGAAVREIAEIIMPTLAEEEAASGKLEEMAKGMLKEMGGRPAGV